MSGPQTTDEHACLDGVFDGAVNLRPVSALRAGSRRIRPGALFRSGMTHQIAPAALAELRSRIDLRAVIDLRTERELTRGLAPFADAGIVHHHAPMEDPLDRDPGQRVRRVLLFRNGEWDWATVYVRIAQASGPSVRRAFELVAGAAEVPLVIHCAAGRDRTGLTIALLLAALGVDREAIADDYTRSGPALIPHVDRFFRAAPTPNHGLTRDEAIRLLDTDRADMLRFLAKLDEELGGVEAYLDSIGVDDGLRTALRARLLE